MLDDMWRPAVLCSLTILAVLCLAQSGGDPWPKTDLVQPADFAAQLQSGKTPMVISVAFSVLYRSRHILHAVEAGPTEKPENIEALKKLVARSPKDADIVIYCGCCPMVRCPNVRPAYRTLKELGFTHVRVLEVPTNMHVDWYTKGYPSEPGSAAGSPQK